MAAIAAVYRETTPGWTLFTVGWTTALGEIFATIFYQAAIFGRAPASSAIWIGAMLGTFAAALFAMRRWADRERRPPRLVGEGAGVPPARLEAAGQPCGRSSSSVSTARSTRRACRVGVGEFLG